MPDGMSDFRIHQIVPTILEQLTLFGKTGRELARHSNLVARKPFLSRSMYATYHRLAPSQRKLIEHTNVTADIQRIYQSSHMVPELTRLTSKFALIREGQLLHHAYAAGLPRKHDPAFLQSEHDEYMTELAIRSWQKIFKCDPPPEIVVEWLLHDGIEDFKNRKGHKDLTFEIIRDFFGAHNPSIGMRIAKGVFAVSIPEENELAVMFPDLNGKKLELKNRFKVKSVWGFNIPSQQYDHTGFTIANCILKLHDNPAALTTYVRDMEMGYVEITNDPNKVTAKGTTPAIKLASEMIRNVEYRAQFQKIVTRRLLELSIGTSLEQSVHKEIDVIERNFNQLTHVFTQLIAARMNAPPITIEQRTNYLERATPLRPGMRGKIVNMGSNLKPWLYSVRDMAAGLFL